MIFVINHHFLPMHFRRRARFCRLRAMLKHFFGALEGQIFPTELFLGFLEIFRSEGSAVALFAAFQRRAKADSRMANDDGGFVRFLFCFFYCGFERLDIVGRGNQIHVQNLPILRRKARAYVLFERRVGVAFNGNVVIVVE